MHLYGANHANLMVGPVALRLTQTTDYPWNGRIALTLGLDQPARFALRLRIPGWCRKATLAVNGVAQPLDAITAKGYATLARD